MWFLRPVQSGESKTLFYKRSRFVTHLPKDFLYSPAHYWLEQVEPGLWRIGMTRFATRMLGDLVDCGFECKPGDGVASGKIIGFVEGFKAISDIYCAADGNFEGENPVLKENVTLVGEAPYGAGWLYTVRGKPNDKCMDVQSYVLLLDKTIDKILEQQKDTEIE